MMPPGDLTLTQLQSNYGTHFLSSTPHALGHHISGFVSTITTLYRQAQYSRSLLIL